jgi:hypothetical protein
MDNFQPELPQPKVKRNMTNAERERNERRKAAFAEIRAINPKAKWTNASKLVSYRNKGNTAKERELLASIGNPQPVKKFTRNNAKESLLRVMRKYNLKPSGSLIQKFLGLHRKGMNNTEFLREVNRKSANLATRKAPKPTAPKPTAPKPTAPVKITRKQAENFLRRKQQVNQNVAQSGLKVNAINRRALTFARKNRPNLALQNFLRNRVPHRTRKVLPVQGTPYPVEVQQQDLNNLR